jgi:hypothetical protein
VSVYDRVDRARALLGLGESQWQKTVREQLAADTEAAYERNIAFHDGKGHGIIAATDCAPGLKPPGGEWCELHEVSWTGMGGCWMCT